MTEDRDISRCTLLHSASWDEIKRKIDDFLGREIPFEDVPLILTADGRSCRHNYRGVSVREWHQSGSVRFDAAVELAEEDARG